MDPASFLYVVMLCAGLLAALYVPSIRTGLNLADEGYLWLGSLKVLEGAVPIRDFRAYDPGRYYWCALWMRLLGRGLLSLRIASMAAGLLGLAMGASAVFLTTQDWLMTIGAACLLTASLYPPYKQIDMVFPMSSAFIAVMLTSDPGWEHFFFAGLFVGMSLVFGLNHALYAGTGFALVIAIMLVHGHGPDYTVALPGYAAGLGFGGLPILASFVLVPGLFRAYWRQKVMRVIKRGATNLALPIPWLWRPIPEHLGKMGRRVLIMQSAFTLMPVFLGGVITLAILVGPSSSLEWAVFAASAIGLGYMHHAMSRANLPHLTQASGPLLIALAILLSGWTYGWVAIAILAIFVLRYIWLLIQDSPSRLAGNVAHEQFEVGGTSLRLDGQKARYLTRIRALVERYSGPGEPVLFVPTLVTLYPLLNRQPACYDIFCVYPATEEEEVAMIRQIKLTGTRFALVLNHPQDERDALRFSNTHPRVWEFLHREFVPLEKNGGLPEDHHVFVKPDRPTDEPM